MPTNTTTYSFQKPVVGADEDAWGGYLNGNWDKVDDLFDGTTPVTGIDINSGTLDGVTIGGTTAGAGTFTTLTATTSITGTLATAAQPNVTSLGTLTSLTVSGDVSFGDNDKAIFGAGSDLQIYHSGTSSDIDEVGTGNLRIGAENFVVQNADHTENMISAAPNGQVVLYHDNSIKFNTSSTGIDVTGTVTADGLTVDTSTLHVDATNNRVGVGTTAPSQKVEISDTSTADVALRMTNNDGNLEIQKYQDDLAIKLNDTGDIIIRSGTPSLLQHMRIANNGDISFYEDTGTTAKFFWDASAERLGIGTTSPSQELHIYGSNEVNLQVEASTSGSGTNTSLRLKTASDGSWNVQTGNAVSGGLRFYDVTNTAERMRIDSSGNLLVGKTSATGFGSTAGFEVLSDGRILSTVSGDQPLAVSRTSSDGNIAEFYKDSTLVGSIGSASGNRIYIGTGNSTLGFSPVVDAVYGYSGDNTVDLGTSATRFKDLYLSGGVYLGGTGAANKLDDYEEGTWTPTLPNGGTLTVGSSAKYRKVGNVVTVSAYLSSINPTANTSQFRIGGLPFASDSTVDYYSGGSFGYVGQNNLIDVLIITGVGLSYIYFHENDGVASSITNNGMRSRGMSGDAADAMIFTITYFT